MDLMPCDLKTTRSIPRTIGLLAALVMSGFALLAALATPGATALQTGLGDPVFKSGDSTVRDYWFSQASRSGAGTVGVHVHWNSVVGDTRPGNPTDPADPAYNFSAIDGAVKGASEKGLDVFLTLFSAPTWAEASGRWKGVMAGAWKPKPKDFGEFAEAVARRYSGKFLPAGATSVLPRVRFYEAWNEPNLPLFLAPQGNNSGTSAEHYRRLLSSFYDAVKSVSPANKVIAGATAPYGRETSNRLKQRTRPMTFFRHLFCLNRKGGKTRCPAKAKFDILSHHGINTTGNPKVPAFNRDDASTADLGKVRKLLRQAEKRKTIGPGNVRSRQIWVTEFWINSDPPSRRGKSPTTQARWIQDSLSLFSRQGVSRAVYFLLRDLPQELDFESAFGAGLFYDRGKPKPSFKAFRTPLSARRTAGGKKIAVWFKRPPSEAVKLQARGNGGWRTVRSFSKGPATMKTTVRETRPTTGRIREMRVVASGSKSSGIPTRVR